LEVAVVERRRDWVGAGPIISSKVGEYERIVIESPAGALKGLQIDQLL
jgi:hypothetical protein